MYVREPPLADTRRRHWYENLLVPYSYVDTTFSFMGPIPEAFKLPQYFDEFFPSCSKENWGPVAFKDSSFDLEFLQRQILCSFPPSESAESIYITWLDRMES